MNRRLLRYEINRLKLNPPQAVNALSAAWALVKWKLFGRYAPSKSPLILMVEPTNRCNFNCPLCDRGSGKLTRREGMMTLSDFQRILDGAGHGLKMLFLWNQGEPLINKEFPLMVRAAKQRGIFCAASTNGSLLKNKAAEVADSGLDELIVSLDGATPETFNLYRRGGDFEEILEGVRKLVEFRGGKSAPLISLQFLLLKQNTREIEDFKRLTREAGADRALWKTVQVGSEAEAEAFLPEEDKYSRYTDAQTRRVKRFRTDCIRLLYSAVVDWNGNMVPCCFDKDEDFIMGNVLEDDFSDVWRGAKFREFRSLISSGKRPPMCANCTEGLKRLFID